MENKPDQPQQKQNVDNLTSFIITEIKIGTDKENIVKGIVEKGADKEQATQLVDKLYNEIKEICEKEKFASSSIVPALLGGGLAALVGGILWGVIASVSNYEIGYMALGIGMLSGFAVLIFTGRKKGLPLQIIAVISSLVGILLGKYIMFFNAVKEAILKEYGAKAASEVTMFSPKTMQIFVQKGLLKMLSGFDALWVVLAVYAAWRILRGMGIDLKKKSVLVEK
jgi:hypothetical protein